MKHTSLRLEQVKVTSLVLITLATLLLVVNIIDIKMIFGRREIGLWDSMPGFVRQTIILAYPISLLTSYILFIWARRAKTKFDKIANILFLLNALAIVLFIVIYLAELTRNL